MRAADDLAHLDELDVAAADAREDWLSKARAKARGGKQLPPRDLDWYILLFLCGRGFGKTEALAQWLWWECYRAPGIIGHWVGPTNGDVENVAFLGPSGLRSMIPPELLWGGSWEKAFRASKKPITLTFANRSIIKGFSATEEAGRLRGPQCHALAGDELREWDRPKGALGVSLDIALLGLRLPYSDGTPARALLATTPKPIPALKRLAKREGVRVVRGSSRENLDNLSESYRRQLAAMAGTTLGKQEIEAAFIDEETDQSIIKRAWIKLWPAARKLPTFAFVVESYDTASSEDAYDRKTGDTDPTACQVWGVFNLNEAFPDPKLRAKLGVRGKYGALLLEAWAERLGMPELLDRARKQHRQKWGPAPGKRPDVVLIENKSSGPGLRQMLGQWSVPVWPINPRMDKAQRLHACAPVAAMGALWVPESSRPDRKGLPRDWVEPALEEICAFYGEGTTEHDDHVDAFSQAVNYLTGRGLLQAVPEVQFLDVEERVEHERREAERVAAVEKRERAGNPYAA